MKWRIADFFLIGVIITVACTIWVYPAISQNGQFATVSQNGIVKTLDLSKSQTITLNHANIEIRNHQIRIKHADCPDQVCVKTGWIKKSGQSIVCIPNHIVITVKGTGAFDAIAN